MRAITKENYPQFKILADQARAAKKQALAEAKALAESLLKADPTAQALAARLERQSAMLDGLILREMAKAGTEPNNRGVKLEQLLRAQGMILAQMGKGKELAPQPGERAKRRMLEPLKAMAERDPGTVKAAVLSAQDTHLPMPPRNGHSYPPRVEPIQPAQADPGQADPAQADSPFA